jgi:hypothetical protein
MSNKRSISWPSFGNRRVVLDDDTRLGGQTPTTVPDGLTYTIRADMQAVAFVRIQVTGTLIIDGTLVVM